LLLEEEEEEEVPVVEILRMQVFQRAEVIISLLVLAHSMLVEAMAREEMVLVEMVVLVVVLIPTDLQTMETLDKLS
jgi:hypothetical protein